MDIGIASSTTTLESRFTDLDAPVLLSGVQAIVRTLLEQARLDRMAGRRTGGFVSGYRGSPLGGLDLELWRRGALLAANDIRFQPGVNEDLAATMLWGTQQLESFPGQTVQGVFGLWYGKGPGVDRSADALRSANILGTSALGGVLTVTGDDHAAHSSVFPHQTEYILQGVMIPVLAPADVADIIDFGLKGIALSRFTGVWVGLKTTAETAEQAATIVVPTLRSIALPPDIALPPHGLNYDPNLRFPRDRAELERRLVDERFPAIAPFARANGFDRLVRGRADASVGLVTVGKAHHDAMHALDLLGLATAPEIAVYKVGLAWPLETEGLRRFAAGKRALLVVEEKRPFVETQVRDALYGMPADRRPSVAGKTGGGDAKLLPGVMELSPEIVAEALGRWLRDVGIEAPLRDLPPAVVRPEGLLQRAPAFCAGCPHATSTRVPEGSNAMAGIGCHFMALDSNDATRTFTHMGGEGVPWAGMAPFTATKHMFVNMGDGTFQHSGTLALRQAVTAGAPITYKILVNDAVAMTGGQPVEGGVGSLQIVRMVAAEGVKTIALVADDVTRLPDASALPPFVTKHKREELDAVQRRLREIDGVSVIVYDQVCANEKRRRRKRGKLAEPTLSVQINPRVCENCGDCSTQSGCIAIEPVATEYGRKRRISPTACNVDLSCLKGFCPSFVTLAGAPTPVRAAPEWEQRQAELAAALPAPAVPDLAQPWRGLFAGVGGGGIVTTGAIVAMAAHLEGRSVSTLDFTGLAQKNGTVVSHVQIAAREELDVVRIPLGTADVMLAADLAVGAAAGVLDRCAAVAAVVGNLDLAPTAAFARNPDLRIDAGLHRRVIEGRTGAARSRYLHAVLLAERLVGNGQAMNTLMLGSAWQLGLVPVSEAALLRAIELNGASVATNRRAFVWGRILADRPELAGEVLAETDERAAPVGLDALVEARAAELADYQGARLAKRYRALVARAAAAEAAIIGAPGALARAVAGGYFHVLAYKDEYEVARLHAGAGYRPEQRPVFHMAPPLITRRDPATGRRRKIAIPGSLALPLFRLLRHGKVLRGTPLDPFGWQPDRRLERAMIATYEADIARLLPSLWRGRLPAAVAIAELPHAVRGFGPVKQASWKEATARRAELLSRVEASEPAAPALAA